jgi:Fungal chitosanase of glycosyl hydrolase group 75
MAVTVNIITKIGSSNIRMFSSDASIFFYRAGLAIDADGSPHAYHPNNIGLDDLANAGEDGNWYGVVTDSGRDSGDPIVQGDTDPAPGYYISATSLTDDSKERLDPRRYVDAETIPYFVLPGNHTFGARLGDFGFVVNSENGKGCGCIFADTGPANKIGEGSIALAEELGIANTSPKNGGVDDGLAYIVFPGSRKGWPLSVGDIHQTATKLFKNWGGYAKIKQGLPNLDW